MNNRPKMRTSVALLSITMLGVSQPVMPMPSEAMPPSTTAQALTREEMAFLTGEIHRDHHDFSALTYLSKQEMAETEGKLGPAAVVVVKAGIGAVGGAAASVGLDMAQGNPINVRNAIIGGISGAWIATANGLAGASGIGQVGSEAIGAAAGIVTAAWGGATCSSCHSTR